VSHREDTRVHSTFLTHLHEAYELEEMIMSLIRLQSRTLRKKLHTLAIRWSNVKRWQDFILERRSASSLEEMCQSAANKRARSSALWLLYIYCHLFCCSKSRSSHNIFRSTSRYNSTIISFILMICFSHNLSVITTSSSLSSCHVMSRQIIYQMICQVIL
jgi:hypothetical protein